MPQRPWAIDDLIVHDDTNLRSVLTGGDGLPAARAWLSQRHGRWPRVSGLARQGYRMTLETYLMHSTEAARLAARTALLQHLNPELEEPVRLTAVDYVLEGIGRDGVLLALGPWDVYCDDDGNWHVRDLLRPNTVEGDLTGGWQIGRDGGMQIAEATTNVLKNPSIEVDTSEWASLLGCTLSRSTAYSTYGSASLKVETAGAAANERFYADVTAETSGNTEYTFSVWMRGDSGGEQVRLYIYDDVSNYQNADTVTLTTDWVRYTFTATYGAGSTVRWVVLWWREATVKTVYCDAFQLEEKGYATPYCDGSLGDGHSWSGTAHASTSSRTAAELDYDDYAADLVADQMTIAFWFIPGVLASDVGSDIYLFEAYGGDNDNRVMIWFDNNSDEIRLYVNGAFRCTVDPSSIAVGDEVFIVATCDYDADEWNLYVFEDDGTLGSDSDSTALSRPAFTSMSIGSSDGGSHQANGVIDQFMILNRVMTQAEATAWRALGRGALNARWLNVLCEAAVPWAPGGVPSLDRGLVATLAVDGDVRWQQRDGDVHFWRCYDGDEETTVTVDSDDDVYPELRITPKTAKTGDYQYKRWVPFIWNAEREAVYPYPILIGPFDTAALVGGGKAQADGDDFRVFVDGVEIDRWFGTGAAAFNQATTKIWVNTSFEAAPSLTLKTAIGAGDTPTEIELNESIAALPSRGILLLDNGASTEAFAYTGKNDSRRVVFGVTRAIRGTSAIALSVGDDAYWVQHDMWLLYGDGAAVAPSVDGDYEPVFDLASSTNGSWVFASFGEDDGLRAGQWSDVVQEYSNGSGHTSSGYGGNQGAAADPWVEIGIETAGYARGRRSLYNPCGIAQAAFTNGEKKVGGMCAAVTLFDGHIEYSEDGADWTNEYTIPDPVNWGGWENWSRTTAALTDAYYISLLGGGESGCLISYIHYVECADVTVTLNATYTPTHSIGSEQSNYTLDCTIENDATGEAIALSLLMGLDETLVVDTTQKVIYNAADGLSQIGALTVVGGVRRDWLRLVNGENVLAFEDSGMQEVEIDLLWNRRLFE